MTKLKTTIGHLFWKRKWISFCSRHIDYESNCVICNTGHWQNCWLNSIGNVIYKISPKFWKWCVNK